MVTPPPGNACWCHPEFLYTPAVIYVQFWGMVQCGVFELPPNGHLFSCFQDPVYPCKWANVPGAYGWEIVVWYYCGSNQTAIYMGRSETPNFFQGVCNGFAVEHTVFPNTWSACNHIYGAHSGFATLFWLQAANDLLAWMALPNDGNTFMEFFMTSENKPIYKFCNKRYSLNQKIAYDP